MAESQKFTPKSEDEIRQEVITDYNMDADDEGNQSFIEKLTKERINVQNEKIESHKKLSKTIKQKVNLRTKLEALGEIDEDEDEEDGEPKPKGDKPQEIDTSKFVSKDELNSTLHRQRYPNLSDEIYNSINALAKAEGKSFEETIDNNPMAKSYFNDAEARERLNGATIAPSTRTTPSNQLSEEDKIAQSMADMAGNGLKTSDNFLKK